MHVVFNSDILFQPRLVTTALGVRVTALLEACRERGHVVVIPETTLLEFQRSQRQLVAVARRDLESAYATIASHGVAFVRQEPENLIVVPDLLELLRQVGGEIELVEPTLEDLRDAHRRACLHEDPHPPDTKSDEMRDLVIWATSLRLSTERGSAILVSRDVVHIHARGDSEALLANLTRAESIEDALECLDVQTPAGRLIEDLLRPAWQVLREAGLPVAAEPTLRAVAQTAFVEGIAGLASADCRVKVPTESGALLTAQVEILISPDRIEHVRFRNVAVGDESLSDLEVEVEGPPQSDGEEYGERLRALNELLGDER